MVSHEAMLLAMRGRALTLEVATTGAISLAATATGYTRATGSFLTDGFRVGMELTGSGFTNTENNDAKVLTQVTAGALTCAGCVVEAAATRTLTVGLPAAREWENVPLEPTVGKPYVREQYLPGPMRQITLGPLGELEVLPIYFLQVCAVANTGMGAATKYADALLAHFAPRSTLTLASGDVLHVRTDPAPFRGQLIQTVPGWALVPVTIPFRLRTPTAS